MKKVNFAFTFLIINIACSCSNKTASINQKKFSDKEMQENSTAYLDTKNNTGSITKVNGDPVGTLTLEAYLRKVPGLKFFSDGTNTKVSVRGNYSFSTDIEPLFVVNDAPINGGLQAASNLVVPSDIKSVTVLKDATSTSNYGFRGANGVIVIVLKAESKK